MYTLEFTSRVRADGAPKGFYIVELEALVDKAKHGDAVALERDFVTGDSC